MALVFDEEQQILQDTAREFIARASPVSALRTLRDERSDKGFDPRLWQQMAELGWPGILIPETYGGVGFGMLGMGAVLEQCGRTLTASPLLSTAVLAATLIDRLASQEQKANWLPQIAAAKQVVALALDETPHHRPQHIETTAEQDAGEFVLQGEKTFVLDGHAADLLLVVARTAGQADAAEGISVFACAPDIQGVTVERTWMVDSRNAARVRLDRARVGAHAILGGPGGLGRAWREVEHALDIARIALAAEMLGGVSEAFDRTVAYLKTREQFGALIGSFQALKHRAAAMFGEVELARSAVMGALDAVENDPNSVPLLASLAKARLAETFHLVSSEAVQMHGGIGMTDEEEIGFFLKRARVAEQTLGDAKYHRDRYARLSGF